MQPRVKLLMAATACLYLGPLLAGLAGYGWTLVPVFGVIFVAWLIVLRPHTWPRSLQDWRRSPDWAKMAASALVQILLVALLFGIGRGIGGALGVAAPFPALLPVLLSVVSIPLARLVWDPAHDPDTEQFLDEAIREVSHVDNPVEQSDMDLARRLIAPLAELRSRTDPEEIARHLVALSGHVEDVHIRTALLERQHSGQASRAETIALILHATDPELILSVGGDGPNLALAVLPPEPEYIALFAERLTDAMTAFPEIWEQCPAVEHLEDLAETLIETEAETPLRALIDLTNRSQPGNLPG